MNNKSKVIPIIDREVTNNKFSLADYKGRKLPIVSDIMFETIINNEKYKKYSAYLLSLILGIDYDYLLNNMKIEKNKIDKDYVNDKGRTTDFICSYEDQINIMEMNNCDSPTTMRRNYSYLHRAIDNYTKRGGEYSFPNGILINFNNFEYNNTEDIIEIVQMKNQNNELYMDRITIINIYLPKIRDKYYNKEELDELEKLLLIMTDDEENITCLAEGNKLMEDYIDDAKEVSKDEIILGLYDKETEKEILNRIYLKEKSEKMARKLAESMAQDIAQEQLKETARKFISSGVSLDIIASATGLSLDELNQL